VIDREKIRQKLHFMQARLKRLYEIRSISPDEFLGNDLYIDASTRMLQIAIEAMLDLSSHIVAHEGWGLPKSYAEVVQVAARNLSIPDAVIETYTAMARFRNRVVHLYDAVDSREVWRIIQENLQDFEPFMKAVVDRYLSDSDNATSRP
jgi:uncharacterized protein YutE (UPF0331/DUF86 family)